MVPTGPGPTGFGYVANSVPFQNVELSGDPSAFTIIQAADDAFAPVDLGSNTLNLYGITYTGNNQLFVSSNGLITFGSGNSSRMNTDLTSGPMQPSVAVFWTDLTKSTGAAMILGEFKDTNGDGTPDELIIEWNQVFRFGVINAAPVTFEAIFHLNNDSQTSSITFNYTSTITGDPASDNGADATVGIKGANAQTTDPSADRLLVSFKSASPFVGSGFTAPPFGNTLSGQVFNDFNRNGVKDAGEPGLANWKVFLDLNRNGVHDPGEPEATTDQSGNYVFQNVPPGSYQVIAETQPGWTHSLPAGTLTTPNPGPDPFGYGAYVGTFQNIDLTADPAAFTIVNSGDDVSNLVDLGSNTFNFYGVNYTGNNQLYVSTNGLISFGTPDINFGNTDLSTAPAEPAIAPLWADWRTGAVTPTVIGKFVDLNGDNIPDELIVEWVQVQTGAGTPSPTTFEAILQLDTGASPGDITFNYINLNAGVASVNNGANATVGIEDTAQQPSDQLLVAVHNGNSSVANHVDGSLVGSGQAILLRTAAPGAYGVAVSFRQTVTGIDFGSFTPPSAGNGSYSVNESATLSVSAPGVLANAQSSLFRQTLSAVLVSTTSHGTLTLNPDGSFTYAPAAEFHGTDSFTYMANDGHNSNVATVMLTVNQVADTPRLTVADTSGNEAVAVPLQINAAPDDNDGSETLSLTISGVPANASFSAGTNTGNGTWTFTQDQLNGLTLLSPDTGTFAFTLTATVTAVSDAATASASAAMTVTVNDVPPANVLLTLSSATLNENDSTSLTGSFTDPGIFDTHTVNIQWGDGQNSTVNLAAGVLTFGPVSHQYLDNPASGSSFAITATITDEDDNSGSGSTAVAVNNVAPANVQLSLGLAAINENDSTSLSGSFTDPGTLDTHTVLIHWGDGSADTTLNLAAGILSFSTSHQYLDNPAGGTYAITATSTDKDGASGSGGTSVTVNNVAPANLLLSLSATGINVNDSTLLSGTFTDPGTLDTHTVVIDWGDGSASRLQ
ncbi:MAG: hypothetical protein E6K70_21825 [Planctomycetota bacterium]|nr:MAG: hypothetical protein E6K70_21825 [Planctomycetota bacterium]